jgi:TolA-binding protein
MYDETAVGRERDMDVGGVATTTTSSGPDNGAGSTASTAAKAGAQAAAGSAKDVAQTAREEARNVAEEASTQVRRVAGDVREQVRQRAQEQHGTMVSKLRQTADELREMSGARDSSPATNLVANLAERTNRFAEQLESRGPEGVLAEVQDFARRKPGTFLLAAAAAGFVVGRVGKSVFTAPNSPLSSGDGGSAAAPAGFERSTATFQQAAASLEQPYGTETTGYARGDADWVEPQPAATTAGGTVYGSTSAVGGDPLAVPDEPVTPVPPATPVPPVTPVPPDVERSRP